MIGLVHQPPGSAEGEQSKRGERHPVNRPGQEPQGEAQYHHCEGEEDRLPGMKPDEAVPVIRREHEKEDAGDE